MPTRRRRLTVSLVLVAVLILATACVEAGQDPSQGPTPTPIPPPPVPDVTTYTVQRGEVIDQVRFSAKVSEVHQERLFFQVGGRVKGVYAQRDDRVEAGQLLAELENDDLLQQLDQVKIDLATAESNLQASNDARAYDIARAEIDVQIKQLQLQKMLAATNSPALEIALANLEKADAARAAAQAAYDRRASQPGAEASPEALNLQRATIDYEIAQASYQQTLQSQQSSQYDIEMKRLEVKLAEMALERLRTTEDDKLVAAVERNRLQVERLQRQVDQTRIISPINGKVKGAGATVGSNVTAYKDIFVVADDSELEITAEPSSSDVSRLEVGMECQIVFNQYADQVFKGTITQLPNQSRNVQDADPRLHIAFEAPGLELRPDMLAGITVVLEVRPDALWLPPIAVKDASGRRYVFVPEEGRTRRLDVKVGITMDDRVEILEGVEEGQLVVVQ